MQMVDFKMMVYVEELDAYLPEDEVPAGRRRSTSPAPSCADRLARGRGDPGVVHLPGRGAASCAAPTRPRAEQGFTVFFTGLSGSGKSTIANVLLVKLLELGGRPVTLLDGDLVRKHLSSELGFSKEHRDINIRRIGFVASEITKNGGIAICAPIAPYDAVRKEVRAHDRAARRLRAGAPVDARSRCASSATARACTPRRGRASSRSSPASPTPTRRRRTPR